MTIRILLAGMLLFGVIAGAGLLSASTRALDSIDPECATPGSTGIEICGEFLEYWVDQEGVETYGEPLTGSFSEIDPDTLHETTVQYFDFARLEYHPDLELEDAGYAVQAGRLGAELLAADGVYWDELPEADPDNDFYMEPTGQAIAPEFQEYWSGHGLDLGDEGVSFRESLALFGYPLTPVEEIKRDGEVLLVQWFERTRLEQNEAGEVTAASLGREASDDTDGLAYRVEREITGVLADVFASHDAPGLGVWLDSSELGEHAWTAGYADPESQQPYSKETHHRIGSVTKPMVAQVVLQLVDEGALDLDASIDEWFSELNGAGDVTIRMLGNMTSGIFNYTEALAWQSSFRDQRDRVWEPEELIRYGFDMTDTASADEQWAYSNTNYVMLGLIIEEVTGNSIGYELQERIFDPLGMEQTSFPESDDTALPEPYAHGISSLGMLSGEADSTYWNASWGWAAGQVISTPGDLLNWLPTLYAGDLLSAEMRDEQFELIDVAPGDALEDMPEEAIESGEAGYGLGVLSDQGWYGHDGLISGYLTMASYRPDLDVSLVAVANADMFSDDYSFATGTAYYEIQQILEREYPVAEEE